jgi:hypothetical protein
MPRARRYGGSEGHGQQDHCTDQQASVQQRGQDDAHEYHLHEATGDRYGRLAFNMHCKLPT